MFHIKIVEHQCREEEKKPDWWRGKRRANLFAEGSTSLAMIFSINGWTTWMDWMCGAGLNTFLFPDRTASMLAIHFQEKYFLSLSKQMSPDYTTIVLGGDLSSWCIKDCNDACLLLCKLCHLCDLFNIDLDLLLIFEMFISQPYYINALCHKGCHLLLYFHFLFHLHLIRAHLAPFSSIWNICMRTKWNVWRRRKWEVKFRNPYRMCNVGNGF